MDGCINELFIAFLPKELDWSVKNCVKPSDSYDLVKMVSCRHSTQVKLALFV